MAWSSDLVRTKNWSTETLTDSDLEGQLDLIINWVMAAMNATTGHDHSGSANKGPKIPIGSLTVASQAQGDVIYASSSTAWTRLAKGTASQVLTMNAGATAPEWTTPTAAPTAASAAEVTTGTEASKYVAPSTMAAHNGVVKGWISMNGTGTAAINDSFNVNGITDNGTGDYTITWETDFGSANYAIAAFGGVTSGPTAVIVTVSYTYTGAVNTAGASRIGTRSVSADAVDANTLCLIAIGDR